MAELGHYATQRRAEPGIKPHVETYDIDLLHPHIFDPHHHHS